MSAKCYFLLRKQHRVDAVIITAEVEVGEITENELHGTVMRLRSISNAAYMYWELSHLFPKRRSLHL